VETKAIFLVAGRVFTLKQESPAGGCVVGMANLGGGGHRGCAAVTGILREIQ